MWSSHEDKTGRGSRGTRERKQMSQNTIDTIANKISCAQFIVIARLAKVVPGPVQMSMPPIRHYDLCFDDYQWYRCTNVHTIHFDSSTVLKFLDRSSEGIKFKEGSKYALAGSCEEEHQVMPILEVLQPADQEITQLFMEMASVPVGWKRQIGGGWVYPIEVRQKPAWWKELSHLSSLLCVRSGRPALLCESKSVDMSVQQIIPADAESKMAPYGDGEFSLTIKNTDPHNSITVPALLSNPETGEISWEDSILIVDTETSRTFCPPGAGVQEHLVPYTLAPNASVKTVINCLALEGEEYWRCGGTRVYFLFCLGEICRKNFFYYYTNAHEDKHNAMIGKKMFS